MIIPGYNEQPQGGEYVVKKGDSLYSIAQKNNTTVDNLKSINNLTTDALAIGQILKLPSTSSSSTTTNNSSGNTYVVKKGDTLYSIARANNTTVDKLKELNNLSSNTLAVGQTINLPSSTNVTYTVKKGDTLYSIAREFGTTVSALTSLNNLSTTALSIGQKLLLP